MFGRQERRRTLLVVGLVVCLGGAAWAAETAPHGPAGAKVISLSLSPEKGREFPFGRVVDAVFRVENLTDKAVVVGAIWPVTNSAEGAIRLSGTAYGSLDKDPKADRYVHNVMRQRATKLPFYVGFLLPGQTVRVMCRYRPLYRVERFSVSYASARAKYEATVESLAPFNVYVLKTGAARSPSMIYVPFTQAGWRLLYKARHVSPPGPGVSTRGVLIPNFRAPADKAQADVSVALSGKAFPGETASAAAARIAKVRPDEVVLAYSMALGGYVVTRDGSSWLLSRPDQAEPGTPLPAVPPELLRDVDSHPNVRIRVGNRQEGIGPERRLAGWHVWDKYPVEYGDGMYTRGEFIRIDRKGFEAFLAEVRKRRLRLGTRRYYFDSRYYVVQPFPRHDGAKRPQPAP